MSGRQCFFRHYREGHGAEIWLVPRPTSERCLLITQPPVHDGQRGCGGSLPLLQRLGMLARPRQCPRIHASDSCALETWRPSPDMSPSSGTGRRFYSRTRHNVWKILGYSMRGRMRVQLLWRRVVPIMSGHALTQWTLRYKTGIVSFVTVGLTKVIRLHFHSQTHSNIYLHRSIHPPNG